MGYECTLVIPRNHCRNAAGFNGDLSSVSKPLIFGTAAVHPSALTDHGKLPCIKVTQSKGRSPRLCRRILTIDMSAAAGQKLARPAALDASKLKGHTDRRQRRFRQETVLAWPGQVHCGSGFSCLGCSLFGCQRGGDCPGMDSGKVELVGRRQPFLSGRNDLRGKLCTGRGDLRRNFWATEAGKAGFA